MLTVRHVRTFVAAVLALIVIAPFARNTADAAPPAIPAQAFGMHFLDMSHPYPSLPFGTARVWDMGVTWADLQPNAPLLPIPGGTLPDAAAPLTDQTSGWDQNALKRLDGIVGTFRSHGADPMITLGMTPDWAANKCNHVHGGTDWGSKTCAPTDTSASGPWGSYVRALAARYQHKVTYYELWNEPSLHNGYNDSIASLAAMAATAQPILHQYGAQLVAPSIAFTNGSPSNGLHWLATFLQQPGGKSFDIAGFHLYPTDAIARANYGPEWTMDQLAAARRLLAHYGVKAPVWNTEVNVGRAQTHTIFTGTAGAAQVARTFLLNIESGVARTIWYAADDRGWGGTWLENSNFRTLTAAGVAERALRTLLVKARPYGCTRRTTGPHRWNYTCRFRLASGKSLVALWTTGRSYVLRAPGGTQRMYTVTGASRRIGGGARLTLGSAPTYLVGTFPV